MNDIPSNSHKSQEELNKAPQKPPIPEFNGKTAGVKRKQENKVLRWLRKMFLSDQKPSDILMAVVEQQIVPGIKDNFRNSLMSSVDMFIYPNSRPTNQPSNNISYSRVYNSQNNAASNRVKTQSQPQVQNTGSTGMDLSGGFTNPCFAHREDRIVGKDANGRNIVEQGADSFLTLMQNYDYPTLSVHTLYMMRKQHIDYTWDAYGWTKEEIANVKIVRINNLDYPWMIDLPPAHVIS